MSNGVDIPAEIITDILSRLPAKSVGQFRCVSKLWRYQLSSQEFITTHLNRNAHRQNLILISSLHSLYSITFNTIPPSDCDALAIKLNFQESDNWEEVLGSCNGLVLVLDTDDKMFLLNPTTREFNELPGSPFALDPLASFTMYGFGYDSLSSDYKVVTLSYYDTDNEHEPDCTDMFVNVYSLKTNYWKRVENSPYDHAVPQLSSGVFINGCVHWLASKVSDYSSVIAGFDLGEEKFQEVPAPVSADKFVFNTLFVLRGCLCMLDDRNVCQPNLWVMNEYGVEESWIKYVICAPNASELKPLCFWRGEELVLDVDGEKLVVSNLIKETSRDLVVCLIPDLFQASGTFVETLVSPEWGNCEEQSI